MLGKQNRDPPISPILRILLLCRAISSGGPDDQQSVGFLEHGRPSAACVAGTEAVESDERCGGGEEGGRRARTDVRGRVPGLHMIYDCLRKHVRKCL